MAKIMGRTSIFATLLAPSDEQLMWRVQTADDHRAFAALVDRWERPIWRLCARMTGGSHRAEDLKQEVFSRLFEHRHHFRQGARLSTWLWRIAVNLCRDELRGVQRRDEEPLEADTALDTTRPELAAPEDPPDLALATREESELVRQGLMQLPEIYRTVLVLRHYEGLKLREIAEVLDVPEGTVNSRMAEALVRLTRLLAPHFEEARTRRADRAAPPLPTQECQVL
jgi:RNA polymerase sigma-70 factor (ECF subfamily)